MTKLGMLALAVAAEKLGEKEATGQNDGPFVRMLQRWVAKGATWLDGKPWCACFATWCVYQAAERLQAAPAMPRSAASTSLYAWLKKHGYLLAFPEPGSVGLVRETNKATGKTHKHTFLVESIDGPYVHGIDGNWKNAVCRTKRLIAECDFGAIV